jgi:predicted transcriptional regulator
MKELTKAEDQIMQILWQIKKGFVKDVIAEMPDPKPAYNTVSTIIRILENKGFISHNSYGKTYEYYPIIERDTYRSFYLKNLLRNYFGGKFEQLVSFFAKDNDLNVEDMEEMLKHVESDLNDPES